MTSPIRIAFAASTERKAFKPTPIGDIRADSLEPYTASLTFPDLYCGLVKNGILLGRDLVTCNQFYYPVRDLWPVYRQASLIGFSREVIGLWIRKPTTSVYLPGAVCSLATHPCWENNLFHWFIDILPRILVFESALEILKSFCLVKPGLLTKWQRDSLSLLGYDYKEVISFPDSSRLAIKADILTGLTVHRQLNPGGLPPYPIFPYIVKALQSRFSIEKNMRNGHATQRIIVIRRGSEGRSFCNLSDIQIFANYHNFSLIDLALLTLSEQICIFKNSSHIIAAHGAGLTHLIHCSQTAVLEIHSSQHGIRPDYFQIAAINDLRYFYHVCPAVNEQGDMTVDLKVLESFIRQTSD